MKQKSKTPFCCLTKQWKPARLLIHRQTRTRQSTSKRKLAWVNRVVYPRMLETEKQLSRVSHTTQLAANRLMTST